MAFFFFLFFFSGVERDIESIWPGYEIIGVNTKLALTR